ncbi:MAG: hypothetical protein REI45_06310, partial [Propionicimonas sp.]|nr:hypothetical protein [Propionicimonas sp.]
GVGCWVVVVEYRPGRVRGLGKPGPGVGAGVPAGAVDDHDATGPVVGRAERVGFLLARQCDTDSQCDADADSQCDADTDTDADADADSDTDTDSHSGADADRG